MINSTFIRTLNPCKEGIVDFETKHPNFNGTLADLLRLENISYSNKTWLVSKIVDIKILQLWSIECAESVLHNYESAYPNDDRISDCINTTKNYILGLATLEELLAAESAAESAARSAESAARSATWSAARSAESATWSAARSAESATWSAAQSAWSAARSEQQDYNLTMLFALLEA